MTLNYLILINGRKYPRRFYHERRNYFIGIKYLKMSIFGGIISGATYYAIHWLAY